MTEIQPYPHPLPSLEELVEETELTVKDNNLTVLLNQNPPVKWIEKHPLAKIKNEKGESVPLPYVPIQKIEWLLTKIYGKYRVVIKDSKIMANSVCVTVTVIVTNPVTGLIEEQDGIGAAPLQVNSGAPAADFNQIKNNAVQIGAPAAETYAIKDAAEKFGKIFGRDLGRRDSLNYTDLLKEQPLTYDDVWELYEQKKDSLTDSERDNADRILVNKESNSYAKLHSFLKSK